MTYGLGVLYVPEVQGGIICLTHLGLIGVREGQAWGEKAEAKAEHCQSENSFLLGSPNDPTPRNMWDRLLTAAVLWQCFT